MDLNFFLYKLKAILLNPAKAWGPADSVHVPFKTIRNSLFYPLITLVSVSAVVGSYLFTNSELSLVYSLFVGFRCFLLYFITIYAASHLLSEITYPLDLGKDFALSFSLVVYSITPFLLCQLLSRIFESLLFVNIIGLYGLYIFWIGTEKLLTPPQYKKMPMLIASAISFAGIYIVANLVLTMLTDRVFHAFFD